MLMARKTANKKAKPVLTFSLGDRVEIMHFGRGKITELRGPLGPGGAEVYRVLYRRKPKPAYIEVLGSQLRPAKTAKRPKPAGGKAPPVAGAPGGVETGVGG
jgi:hypothetical protein